MDHRAVGLIGLARPDEPFALIVVSLEGLFREAHGVSKGIIPWALIVDRIALWIASGQGLN